MTTKYEDIGKEGNDLLTKGFPANSAKIAFENAFPEGFEMKTNIERTYKDNKESVGFNVESNYTYQNFKLKTKFPNKPEKEVSVEAKNLLTDGTLFEVGTSEKSRSYFGSVGFSDDKVNLSAMVNYPHDCEAENAELVGNGYAVINFPQDIFWGVHANAKRGAKSSGNFDLDLNGRIHFVKSSFTLFFDNLIGAKTPHSLGLQWSQKVSPETTVVTKYTCSTDLYVAPTLEAVIEQKVENGGVFKTKASVFKKEKTASNLNLTLGFAYTNKFSTLASYTIGGELNGNELFGARGTDGVSLGFEIKLK